MKLFVLVYTPTFRTCTLFNFFQTDGDGSSFDVVTGLMFAVNEGPTPATPLFSQQHLQAVHRWLCSQSVHFVAYLLNTLNILELKTRLRNSNHFASSTLLLVVPMRVWRQRNGQSTKRNILLSPRASAKTLDSFTQSHIPCKDTMAF